MAGSAPCTGRPVGGGPLVAATFQPRRIWSSLPAPLPPPALQPYDFRIGVPDPQLFPWQAWRRLISQQLRPSAVHSGEYGDPAGHPGLRAAIARHFGISRSVRAVADDVVVTHGAQQALDLIGRVLIEPGATVAVEEPGYQPVRDLFGSLGAKVIGVPVDEEGVDVTAIPRHVRLLYVTPSHQYPLGTAMSLRRRTAVLDWAGRQGAVVIEDDYDSEYRFADRPLEPLQSLDRDGRVVYVGSFSKTMLPLLRVGFLIAPASLQPALRSAKQLSDWTGEHTTQAALARFLDEGMLARHLRRATRVYGQRRAEISAALANDLAGILEEVPSVAGLHVCARVGPDVTVDLAAALAAARADGVTCYQLADYHAGPCHRDGIVLGFGTVRTGAVVDGMRRLTRAIRQSTVDG